MHPGNTEVQTLSTNYGSHVSHSTVVRAGNECWPLMAGGVFVVTHCSHGSTPTYFSQFVKYFSTSRYLLLFYLYFTLKVIYQVNARMPGYF